MTGEPEGPIDFNALAKEALAETYDPRAQRCWPWSHRWTMWEQAENAKGAFQTRRCTGCGYMQRARLHGGHVHSWKTIEKREIVREHGAIPTGVMYTLECRGCGELWKKVIG
jgi:hypothetical protein